MPELVRDREARARRPLRHARDGEVRAVAHAHDARVRLTRVAVNDARLLRVRDELDADVARALDAVALDETVRDEGGIDLRLLRFDVRHAARTLHAANASRQFG